MNKAKKVPVVIEKRLEILSCMTSHNIWYTKYIKQIGEL